MIVSVFILLGLLAVIPAYGIGYLLNALSHKWWMALPVYAVFAILVVTLGRASMTGLAWYAVALVGVGALVSSVTVRQFQRGNYVKRFSKQ